MVEKRGEGVVIGKRAINGVRPDIGLAHISTMTRLATCRMPFQSEPYPGSRSRQRSGDAFKLDAHSAFMTVAGRLCQRSSLRVCFAVVQTCGLGTFSSYSCSQHARYDPDVEVLPTVATETRLPD